MQVRCPECKVIPEELHNEGGVLVAFFAEGIQFGNGIIECLLGKVASTVGRVENFVVEDRKVQGKTKSDWVSSSKLNLCDFSSTLVSFVSRCGSLLSVFTSGEFCKVTVVVTLPMKRVVLLIYADKYKGEQSILHLVVEDLGFASSGRADKMFVQDGEDITADIVQFIFNLLSI